MSFIVFYHRMHAGQLALVHGHQQSSSVPNLGLGYHLEILEVIHYFVVLMPITHHTFNFFRYAALSESAFPYGDCFQSTKTAIIPCLCGTSSKNQEKTQVPIRASTLHLTSATIANARASKSTSESSVLAAQTKGHIPPKGEQSVQSESRIVREPTKPLASIRVGGWARVTRVEGKSEGGRRLYASPHEKLISDTLRSLKALFLTETAFSRRRQQSL